MFQKAQWTERVIFPLQKWLCASSLSILITVTTIPSVKPLKLAIEITFSHLNPNIVVILNVDDYWTCSFFFIKSPLLLHSRSPPPLTFCAMLCLLLSRVWLFATPWTVACHAPVHSPAKNTGVGCHALSSRASSWPRDQTQVSSNADEVLYGLSPREVPGSLEEAPTHCPLIYFFTQQTHWF